jgi:hypothetical protein
VGNGRSLLPKASGRGPRWRLPRHGWPRYASSTSWHPLSGSVWLPEAIEGLAARVREQEGRPTYLPTASASWRVAGCLSDLADLVDPRPRLRRS